MHTARELPPPSPKSAPCLSFNILWEARGDNWTNHAEKMGADPQAVTPAEQVRGGRHGRTSEFMDLDNASTAYLLGKQGVTKNRLADFTRCGLEIGHSKVRAHT